MSGIKEVKKKRQKRRRRRQIQRLIVIFGCLIVCTGLIMGVRGIVHKITEPPKTPKKKTTAKPKIDTSNVEVKNLVINTNDKKKSNESTSITVSSMGDCTLGTDVNFDQSRSLNAFYNAQGADYFFKNVKPILEEDDLSIVNFEGTLTDSDQRAEKKFAFKAKAEYAGILTHGSVEAANMANNHSADYGEQSRTDTIKTLEDAGIATFGYEQVQILEINGIKVGLTGIYELAEHLEKKQQVKENIAALKEAGAQLIIVNFHWGIEREYVPNDTQKALARLAVDQGADLVIGHHPHVLQGVEKYKGKYIAYSLGNFCFGGNSNPEDKDTMIFQQTFSFKDGKLTEAKEEDVNMIPCSISSTHKQNDYCPTPLEGDEKQRVLNKIEEYSNQIQGI